MKFLSNKYVSLSLASFLVLAIGATVYAAINLNNIQSLARNARGTDLYVNISVSPNPISANSQYTINFSNLKASHGYNFTLCMEGVCSGNYWLRADQNGTNSMTFNSGAASSLQVLVKDVTCCKTPAVVGSSTFTIK